jgi:hypothetical protein
MRWPWRRRERRTVDIDPVQLIVVHHLLRFGASPIEALYREVEGVRSLPREMFDVAMALLVADDVADYRFRPEDGTTLLALTELGMRLRGKLPKEARSRLAIYV